MFGTLPSYGFFCRHVKGLKLQDICLQTATPDYRHALVLDGVEDVVIDALDAPFAGESAPPLRLNDAVNVALRNCRPPEGTDVFLSLSGSRTKAVALSNNDFAGVKTICARAPEVPESALILWSNYVPK